MCFLLVGSARLYIADVSLFEPDSIYTEEEGIKVDYPTYVFYNTWFIPVNILMTISSWSTVAMGVFRIVAVFSPLKSMTLCTVRRVQGTLLGICIFSVLVNIPNILKNRVENGIFHEVIQMEVYNTISVVFAVPLPILSVLGINILLIARIRLYRAQMDRLFDGHNSQRRSEIGRHSSRQGETTLIAVSMFCVLMSVPNVIYFILHYTGMMPAMRLSPISLNMFYIISNVFLYINYASNFFLYVLLNKSFRNLLWKKVRRVTTNSAFPSTRTSTIKSNGVQGGDSMKLKRVISGNEQSVRSFLLDPA